MDSFEEEQNKEIKKDEEQNIVSIKDLVDRTILELKNTNVYIDKMVDEENEDADTMMDVKKYILSKIQYLENMQSVDNIFDSENISKEKEAERKHVTEQEQEEQEEEKEKKEKNNTEKENENEIYVDIELVQQKANKEDKQLTFFQDFQKNNSNFQMMYLKKKEVVGYTASGDAIIINNQKFIELMNDCFPKSCLNKKNLTDTKETSSMENTDKCNAEEENYFSETSCSTSSIISLHSFVKKQKELRIQNNRKQYVQHRYFDDAYMNHQLEECSDCSVHSFDWYNDKSDHVFYHSNLLKEDRQVAHKGTLKMPMKSSTRKKWQKPISPFYKYIYFKRSNENDGIWYPVFINMRNGKRKLCNLKKRNKYFSKYDFIRNKEKPRKENKWELDPSLFSYKSKRFLNSTDDQKDDEEIEIKAIESTELLSEYKKEVLEIERTAENLMNDLKKACELQQTPLENVMRYDRYDKLVRKYTDFIEKKNNFRFNALGNVEKINLKLKIVGSDGTVVKHKRLERLSIDKSQTFGYLAKKLGKCFHLSDEDIENIKIVFDGDVCDKDATFDDETIGLQDDFQLDVQFPKTKEKILGITNLYFDQCYPIIHPDYYQID